MSVITWTELPDKFGKIMTAHSGTWSDLVARLQDVGTFPSKDMCPWIKGAAFGNLRTAKGSLRSNENVTSVFAIEGDYDLGAMQPDTAVRLLENHGVKAAIYPSPNSGLLELPKYNGGPRWRVIAPLSKPHPPEARAGLVARLNGALGGVLAPESFTLSQGYFFGATPGNDYRVAPTFNDPLSGQCVDVLHDLDSIAKGKNWNSKPDAQDHSAAVSLNIFDEAVAHHGRLLIGGDGRRELLKTYIASRSAKRLPADELQLLVNGLAAKYFDPHDPIDDDNVGEIIEYFASKDSKVDFSDEVENTSPNVQRYKVLRGAALRTLPLIAWRVHGVLPTVGLAGLYGPSASGKSFLALDLAATIASGGYWFGHRVQAAPVIYAVLENEGGTGVRVQAWEKHNGRNVPDDLGVVQQPFTLTNPQDVVDFAAVCPDGAVVFIDTLNRAAPTADENSSRDMGLILQAAKTLQAMVNGLVVVVHHTGKNTDAGMRGHSSLFAAMDAAIEVSRKGDSRDWRVAKSKDGKDGGVHPFTTETVILGTNEYGEVIDSCVVVPASPTTVCTKPLTADQKHALAALATALEADVFDTGVSRGVWRGAFYLHTGGMKTDARRKAFDRAVAELTAQGRVYELNGVFSIPDF